MKEEIFMENKGLEKLLLELTELCNDYFNALESEERERQSLAPESYEEAYNSVQEQTKKAVAHIVSKSGITIEEMNSYITKKLKESKEDEDIDVYMFWSEFTSEK
jgi:hypothetical protein